MTEEKVFLVYLDRNPTAFMVQIGKDSELPSVREKIYLKLKLQEDFSLSFLLNGAIVNIVDGINWFH